MKQFKILLLVNLVILFATSLVAQTFNVSTTVELRVALTTAETNGEDDTIVLADGAYLVTDDAIGTFIYSSSEDNNLTLKGSSRENVILHGIERYQIFNHQSNNGALILESLSFINGYSTENGGAVYTNSQIQVVDCNISNNVVSSGSYAYGGGFYSASSVTVTNSILTNNSTSAYVASTTNAYAYGGGFYSETSATVTNSILTNNSTYGRTSGFGGGFFSRTPAAVTNSILANNNSGGYSGVGLGGGFYSASSATVTSSIFTNNDSTSGSAIYISASDSNFIYNSIFLNNTNTVIAGGSTSYITRLGNNYRHFKS